MLVALALTACTPEPDPSPTPTGFASDAEAFAAAEKTYRAYVDALNAIDFGDPSTFEPVLAWTTGTLNAEDRRDFSHYHANDMEVVGAYRVTNVTPADVDASASMPADVAIDACFDVSDTDVLDGSGSSVVSTTRPDVLALRITLVPAATPTGLAIASVSPTDGGTRC